MQMSVGGNYWFSFARDLENEIMVYKTNVPRLLPTKRNPVIRKWEFRVYTKSQEGWDSHSAKFITVLDSVIYYF